MVGLGLEHNMTHPLHRGSSAGRSPESGCYHVDTPLKIQVNSNEGDSNKLYGNSSGMSTQSLRLLMKQANQDYSTESFRSSQKAYQRSGENGFKYSTRMPDDSMPSNHPGSPPKDKGCVVRTLEICSLRSSASSPSLSLFASSSLLRSRRVSTVSLGRCLMLCFIGIFVLFTVLGSSKSGLSMSSIPKLGIFKIHRRLQQEVSLEFSNGGIFGLGTVRPKELGTCSKALVDYVPCYNVSASLHAGFKNGEEYDRHCDLTSSSALQCLIPPPSDYRIPFKWPASKNKIWSGNVKVNSEQLLLDTGARTKRLMLLEENLITFHSGDVQLKDGVESSSQQIATLIGLQNDTRLIFSGVQTVLDIGCDLTSFGSHLLSRNMLTLCLAPFEGPGSQVQFALERGLPAMIGSFVTRQLPYPMSSFDMIYCSDCGLDWSQKDGVLIMEVDRLLKPRGYFVWISPMSNHGETTFSIKEQKWWNGLKGLAKRLCWDLLSQEERTFVWKKTADLSCYILRGPNARPNVCAGGEDADDHWNQPLRSCIVAALPTGRGTSVQPDVPSESAVALPYNGLSIKALSNDSVFWSKTVKNYWSLLAPLIFSDHPKRPGEEDPLAPSNMVRNIMDMNAMYGGLNAALLRAGKTVWVMNVVPISGPNTLPVIYSRGFIGTLHNWCEAFPTYPRTYDMLNAIGLLSQEAERPNRCGLSNLFLEMDRILRPEGWVFLRDETHLIEDARVAAVQMRWEARVIEVEGNGDLRLLVCQKPFWKN